MKQKIVIANESSCRIEIIHRKMYPTVWIVRYSKKYLWFRKRISSTWFIDQKQAMAFADELKREHAARM